MALFQLKRGNRNALITHFDSAASVPADGEVLFEKDNNALVVGDGTTTYDQLKYFLGKTLAEWTSVFTHLTSSSTTVHSQYSPTNHTHTAYSPTNHTHTAYSATDHTHTAYSATDHTHTAYSATDHTHTAYSATDHTHTATRVDVAYGAGGTTTLTYSPGAIYRVTAAGGSTTWSISGLPTAGTEASWSVELTNGGVAGQTWFTNTKWDAGLAPSNLTSSGVDIFTFYTVDSSSLIRGFIVAKDSK